MNGRFSISFRTKIALLAGAITGVIVLGACSLLWNMTYRFNLVSLDRDVLNIAQANMQRVVGRQHWVRLDESLSYLSGESEETLRYSIWAESRGRREYVSGNWPGSLGLRDRFASWEDRRNDANPPNPPDRQRPISESNPALKVLESSFVTENVDGVLWRVGVFYNFYGNLAIAVDLDNFDSRMDRLKWRYYLVAPLALFLAVSGGWFVAKRILRPVEKLTLAVEGLSAQELEKRIEEVGHEKEFQRLVGMFNEMMGRLEKSFFRIQRFSADASHELKTPLARVQMELEAALREAEAGSREQVMYSSFLDEIAWLGSVVEKLTLLSSSDSGKLQITRTQVDLGVMLKNVSEDCQAMTGGRIVDLEGEDNVKLSGDAVLLEQALQNLSRNAQQHGSAEGQIRFCLKTDSEWVWIQVANEGEPIGFEDQERIFERFFQTDLSRSTHEGGVGLGLSLSREIVRAHGGELRLKGSDEHWTIFEIKLQYGDLA
jgi:two-component system, OmpR family, heavy metal sensor histidine kinase CusS